MSPLPILVFSLLSRSLFEYSDVNLGTNHQLLIFDPTKPLALVSHYHLLNGKGEPKSQDDLHKLAKHKITKVGLILYLYPKPEVIKFTSPSTSPKTFGWMSVSPMAFHLGIRMGRNPWDLPFQDLVGCKIFKHLYCWKGAFSL